MLSTVVTANPNTAQVFFLIATIVFIIAAVVTYPTRTFWATLVAAGLAFASLGLLFFA